MEEAAVLQAHGGFVWKADESARHALGQLQLLKSIDIEIAPCRNLTLIELANFFQHLFLAAGIAAVLCARLVTACITAVVHHQEVGLCPVGDLRKLPC